MAGSIDSRQVMEAPKPLVAKPKLGVPHLQAAPEARIAVRYDPGAARWDLCALRAVADRLTVNDAGNKPSLPTPCTRYSARTFPRPCPPLCKSCIEFLGTCCSGCRMT